MNIFRMKIENQTSAAVLPHDVIQSDGSLRPKRRIPRAWASRLLCLALLPASAAVLCVRAGHAQPASAPTPTITKGGDDFIITARTYAARVNGKTGMLEALTIDGLTAVESTSIDLERRPFTKIAVVQESPTKVTSYFSADDNNQPVDKALRVSYDAQPDSLVIRTYSTVGRVSGKGMRFNIGHEAQMVRSLDSKENVPMPVMQGRSPWMRVKYFYSNGGTLGITNEGAGNPFNANENGGVSGYMYSRGGYVANTEYVYNLIAERGAGKKVLGSPSMQVAEASTPAVFWQGEPVVATLRLAKKDTEKIAAVPGLRIKYTVLDVFETQVAKGEVPLNLAGGEDKVEVKVPLPITKLGWYRAFFTVNDASGSLLESQERLIFSVLGRMPNMGEKFDNQIQTDYTIGLGLTRDSIHEMKPQDLDKRVAQQKADATGTDVYVTYQIDGPPGNVGNDPKKFGQYLADMFTKSGDKIGRIEIINEPNGTLTPKQYMDTFLRPAYENIKRVSPQTKVIGPVLVGVGSDSARYLEELYKLGLKDVTDELSFHPYAGNFDDGNAMESMRHLLSVIAANGDAAKPIHFTEAGYNHGGWSDTDGMREVIKWLISQYAWQDAIMGIDYRHNFYYFTDQMGYYDFWLRSTQLTPAAVAMRNYTGLVKGQSRAQLLNFGSREDVRGFLYPGPTKQVVALWTAGNRDATTTTEVTFDTDAKEVLWLDSFGNPLPAKVTKGKLTLAVPTFPTYLVLGPKTKLTPVPMRWGTNLALASLGAVAEATSEEGTLPAVSAIDGNNSSASAWRSLTPNELPQTLTVSLAGPSPVDRVGLWSYNARGYDLEAMGPDGKWIKLVSRRDQPYRRFRMENFKPLVTDQLRVTIVDSYSDRAEVAEMQVFSPQSGPARSGAGAVQMDLVNWALASEGATARASSEMSKEITVAEQDYGAKAPRITKTMAEAKAVNAIDGKRLINGWREFFPTTWMAKPGSALPQWLEVSFKEPKTITSVAVYTIAFATWAPADSGIKDWDVQVWDGKDWKTVDSVRDNQKVSKISRLKTPVKTDKIRILVTATNDREGTIGIMEVQAFGPRK